MKTTIKGIKQAVTDFNNWKGSAIIYLDKSNGTVWTKVYNDCNSYTRYNDNNIVAINKKSNISNDTISMQQLKDICQSSLTN